jgi:hypothetical protein
MGRRHKTGNERKEGKNTDGKAREGKEINTEPH